MGYCCPAQDCERQNALPKTTQRFEPRLSLAFDLFYGQAGNTVDKGNFSKIKKWDVLAHNSFPAPNTACSVLSRRIRRALCNPRKAEGQRQGLPCPSAASDWLLRGAPPSLSPLRQCLDKSLEQSPHFPTQVERPLLEKQWSCCGSKELSPSWGQKLSLIGMTTCPAPPFVEV